MYLHKAFKVKRSSCLHKAWLLISENLHKINKLLKFRNVLNMSIVNPFIYLFCANFRFTIYHTLQFSKGNLHKILVWSNPLLQYKTHFNKETKFHKFLESLRRVSNVNLLISTDHKNIIPLRWLKNAQYIYIIPSCNIYNCNLDGDW